MTDESWEATERRQRREVLDWLVGSRNARMAHERAARENAANGAAVILATDYIEIIARDRTTDGEPCYLGWLLEAPGCMGMGATVEACRDDLRSARADYFAGWEATGVPLPAFTRLDQPIVIDLSKVKP